MPGRDINRTLIQVPARANRTLLGSVTHALKGLFFGPLYWFFAAFLSLPGMRFRAWSFALGLRALFDLKRRLSAHTTFHLLFMPMESTRYFELAFAQKMLAQRAIQRYLDLSSPRLLPVYVLDSRAGVVADLINPNPSDLQLTARLVNLVGAQNRCQLHGCRLADASFAPETFDVITSISVLEHIPEDLIAVRQIWKLLKPGGTFVLTVPCMLTASEQYIDRDEWGLLDKNEIGQVFWQRFYDQKMLEQRIFSVTGEPQEVAIYGEKIAGTLLKDSIRKRSDPFYPYWREPFTMATEYQSFNSLDELPGEGVIAFMFVKTS